MSRLARATEAYAAYLNAPRGIFDAEEQLLFDADLVKARDEMEREWLERTPTQAGGVGGFYRAMRRVRRRGR